MKNSFQILFLKGPHEQLTFGENFTDLYLGPALITAIAILMYAFAERLVRLIQPLWLAFIIVVVIFFSLVYLIDRFLEYWRYDIHNSYHLRDDDNGDDNNNTSNTITNGEEVCHIDKMIKKENKTK